MARGGAPEQAATTFRDVFAVAEFRALWAAQLLSVIGDQLARVALTVLVYDRTRSALLAAITFVASIVPTFVGGVMLAWLADRYPRRRVMIACDLVRCALVLVMAIPGVPLAGLVALLFLVTLVGAPFTSARAAVYPDVLAGDRYVMGTAVTTHHLPVRAGPRLRGGRRRGRVPRHAPVPAHRCGHLRRVGTHRPGRGTLATRPGAGDRHEPSRLAGIVAGARLVFARPALRMPMFFGWLAAFYQAPEGVVTPLARDLHGGAAAVGVILAAEALGETTGAIVVSRFLTPPTRLRVMGPLAIAACGVLALFFLRPGLPGSLLILFASGLGAGYQIAANAAFVSAAPQEQRSQAFGLAQGGMSLGQGVVMILAGAVADHYSPAWVIAVAGTVGAMVALAIAISWARERRRTPNGHLQRLRVSPSGRRAWRAPSVRGGSVRVAGFSPSGRRAWRAPSWVAGWIGCWVVGGSAPVAVAHDVLLPESIRVDSLSN